MVEHLNACHTLLFWHCSGRYLESQRALPSNPMLDTAQSIFESRLGKYRNLPPVLRRVSDGSGDTRGIVIA